MSIDGILTGREISIRSAGSDDLGQLRALDIAVFQRLAYPDFVLRQMFDVYSGWWQVAEHSSRLVGYSLGVPTPDRTLGWLLGLAVAPEYRNIGCGRRLTVESLRLLRSMGVREACLTVEPSNIIAIELYRNLGFSVSGLYADYLGPGEDRILMVLQFDSTASNNSVQNGPEAHRETACAQ